MKITNLVTGFSLLVASFVFTFSAKSQSYLQIRQKNPTSGAMEACRSIDTFTLIIKNISAVALSNMDVFPSPSNVGIVYGGFVGVSSGTVTTVSTSPMQFNIPTLSVGDSILLRYTAKAVCSALVNISGNTAINYADVSFDVSGVGRKTESLTTAVSYNLLYPRLDIAVNAQPLQVELDNAKIGDVSSLFFTTIGSTTRQIQVTNTGNGSVDTVIIRITPEPEIHYNGFSNFTGSFSIPATYVGSDVVITLFGSALANFKAPNIYFDNILHQSEDLLLVEDFDVIACGAELMLSDYYVESACFGTNCTMPGSNHDDGNVGVGSGQPNIQITIGAARSDVASYCNDEGVVEFYFTNTKTDFGDYATNLLLDVISDGNDPFSGFSLYDFEINGQPLAASGVTVTPLSSIQWYNIAGNNHPGYRIDLSANTNSAIALDWDNDGQKDDLGAGYTLKLTAKLQFNAVQPFESQCPINYYSRIGLPQAKYGGSCNTTNYTVNVTEQTAPLNYEYYSASISANGGFNGYVNGTNDMVEGVTEVFEFCTGSYSTAMDFFKCPVDSFYAEIILPDGYALVGTSGVFTSAYSGTETLNAVSDGDTITIFGGGHSTLGAYTQWTGCYSVPLTMACSLSSTGTIPRTSDLSWRMNYICDTCDLVQHRVCDNFTVYNHASCSEVAGCPGISSTGFDADRTSFGYTDNTMTTKVTALSSGIDLNSAYPYDTVQTRTQGIVNSLNIDKLYCEIKAGAPDVPFVWLDGVFTLTDASGFPLPDCPITTPPTITGDATIGYTYTFEIPFSCYGGAGANFTVNLINNWQVNNSALIFGSAREIGIVPFRSGFYSDRNDTIFHCDEWGTNFKFLSLNTYPWVESQGGTGCADLNIKLWMTNLGGKNGNDFPNEYRPVIKIDDKITFHIPSGYDYIGNAFTIAITGVSAAGTPIDVLVPIIPTFIDADSVVFQYPWALIDKYNSNSTSDSIFPILKFSLKPDCDRRDTMKTILDYGFTRYYYTENPAYYVHENYTYDPNYGSGGFNVKHIDPKANITVNTGAYIVDGYTKTVKWNITVCNRTDGTHPTVTGASYVWIDIQNVLGNIGNITIDRFYETGAAAQNAIHYLDGADENSYIQLGALNANVCKSFTLEGSYTGCNPENLDSLNLVTGWNCTGYPDTSELETAACQVAQDLLALRYKLSSLALQVLTAPVATVDICDTLHYVVQLESNADGFMYDVNFWAELPTGASLINGEYNYITNLNNWRVLPTPVNSFTGSNSEGWHLSQILTQWSQYGGGFIGSQKPDSAKIQLRFDIALNCDYNPNDSIVLYSSGLTNCNQLIPLFNIQRIGINGFTTLDELNVSVEMPDTLQCEETGRIDITVTNLNTSANQFEDSLKVVIPDVFGVLMTLPFGASQQDDGINTTVKWKIPPLSIGAGASSVYSIFVLGVPVTSCTEIPIAATVYYVGSSQCGLTVCNPTAIIDVADSSVTLCCDPCLVNAEFEADTVCYSQCCGGADTTCFRLVDQTTIGADYIHFWDFGDGFNATDAEPCHIYDTVGVYFACHTVTQISTGCFETFCDSVRVIDKPTGAIELLGCNPFCEGDTVHLTVNGTYTDITWVMLPSGTIVGTDDTLTVTQAGRYNAILTNGICTSECLAIDIHTQIPPDIDIPDTAICLGDSIYICAGGGFTSYEWQLNGTVINTVDSCIWIKTVGQYIVTVGDKLPVGCCTCEGIDTFTVIINTIDVTVPDLTICEDASGTLCATPSGGYPPYTYSWQPNGEITPCITVNTAGDYIATVTDNMGCTAVDTGTVTLELPPNAEFIYDDTICINSEYCYVPVQTAGTHYWEVADSNSVVIATSNNITFCYTFPFVGTFSVTHILTNNCGSDTVTHFIEVVPPVEACIVLIGSNPFCVGDTVCLTTNDPYNQITQVEWYLNDVLVFVGDMYCVTEPGTYRAKVTDNHGCISECMCIVLTQIPAPVVDLPDNLTICDGQINAVLDAGAGHTEYIWFRNNTFYAYGVSSVSVTTAGTYRVEVTGANGCKTIDSTVVNLALGFTIIGSTHASVCRNGTFTVFTACNSNLSYQWFMATNSVDQGAPVANSDTCRLTLTGNQLLGANTWFNLEVTNKTTGCISRAKIRIIHRIRNCNEIDLFPNPVLGNTVSITYDLMDAGVTTAIFEFRNVWGDVVATYPTDPELQEAILDISGLSNGVYHVSLIADGVTIDTQRLVIAR